MAAVEKAIVAHDDYERTECEGNNSKVDEGALVGLMKHVLGTHGISVQRYWNGALVGPDCRRLLENHEAILEAIRQGMVAARHSGGDAKDFVNRHTSVMKELVVVSSFTRRVNGAGAGGASSPTRSSSGHARPLDSVVGERPANLDAKGAASLKCTSHGSSTATASAACSARTSRRRCTWWTTCAGTSCARFATPRTATRRTSCTTRCMLLRRSYKGRFSRGSRRSRRRRRWRRRRRRRRQLFLLCLPPMQRALRFWVRAYNDV